MRHAAGPLLICGVLYDRFGRAVERSAALGPAGLAVPAVGTAAAAATSNARVVYIIEVLGSRKQYEAGAVLTSKGPPPPVRSTSCAQGRPSRRAAQGASLTDIPEERAVLGRSN